MAPIRSLISIIFALLLVLFIILNRQEAPIVYNPFDETITVPVYLIILGGVIFGFFWGALSVFFSHHKIRKERSQLKKKARELEKDLRSHQPAVIANRIPD